MREGPSPRPPVALSQDGAWASFLLLLLILPQDIVPIAL